MAGSIIWCSVNVKLFALGLGKTKASVADLPVQSIELLIERSLVDLPIQPQIEERVLRLAAHFPQPEHR